MPRTAPLTVKQRRSLKAERMEPVRYILTKYNHGKKAELARYLGVSRSLVTKWFNTDAMPSQTVWLLAGHIIESARR